MKLRQLLPEKFHSRSKYIFNWFRCSVNVTIGLNSQNWASDTSQVCMTESTRVMTTTLCGHTPSSPCLEVLFAWHSVDRPSYVKCSIFRALLTLLIHNNAARLSRCEIYFVLNDYSLQMMWWSASRWEEEAKVPVPENRKLEREHEFSNKREQFKYRTFTGELAQQERLEKWRVYWRHETVGTAQLQLSPPKNTNKLVFKKV